MTSINTLVTLLEAFFNNFFADTQTRRHCFTPAVHARVG